MITELPVVEPLDDAAPSLELENQRGAGETERRTLTLAPAARVRWADAGILLSILLIGFMSYLTLRNTRQDEEDAAWVVHAEAVQNSLEAAFSHVADTESASRAFVLTGQTTFLDVEGRADRLLSDDLQSLRQLTAEDAGERKRLDRLQQQVPRCPSCELARSDRRHRADLAMRVLRACR